MALDTLGGMNNNNTIYYAGSRVDQYCRSRALVLASIYGYNYDDSPSSINVYIPCMHIIIMIYDIYSDVL